MLRRSALLAIAGPMAGQNNSRKAPKPPDLEIVEFSARRSGDQIHMDGRIRNTGPKPLERVTMIVDFFAPGRKPMVSKRGPVEAEMLEPGEESAFQLAMPDSGQLVHVELQAVDRRERDLRLSRTGPFVIE